MRCCYIYKHRKADGGSHHAIPINRKVTVVSLEQWYEFWKVNLCDFSIYQQYYKALEYFDQNNRIYSIDKLD